MQAYLILFHEGTAIAHLSAIVAEQPSLEIPLPHRLTQALFKHPGRVVHTSTSLTEIEAVGALLTVEHAAPFLRTEAWRAVVDMAALFAKESP